MTIHTDRLLGLGLEVSSLRCVGLARVGPERLRGHCYRCSHLRLICVDIVRLPVLGGVSEALLTCLLEHLLRISRVVPGSPSVGKKLGVVHQIVLHKVVSIF